MAFAGWKNKVQGAIINGKDASHIDLNDERLGRAISGTHMVGITVSLIFASIFHNFHVVQMWSIFMFFDSLLRVFAGNPNCITGRIVNPLLKDQGFIWQASDPKQFTALIQTGIAFYMMLASNILMWHDKRIMFVAATSIFIAWVGSVLNICLFSKLWLMLTRVGVIKPNETSILLLGDRSVVAHQPLPSIDSSDAHIGIENNDDIDEIVETTAEHSNDVKA